MYCLSAKIKAVVPQIELDNQVTDRACAVSDSEHEPLDNIGGSLKGRDEQESYNLRYIREHAP